jgi:hypothetical protein
MSWRDRLVGHDPGAHPGADTGATEAIGTIGAFDNGVFSPAARQNGVAEHQKPTHVSSPDVPLTTPADSTDSAVRSRTTLSSTKKRDAISAKSVDRWGTVRFHAKISDAISADSANRDGVENAPIVEHDGGAPRAWCEGFARLDRLHSPADVPPRRWQTFLDDCAKFLNSGWAQKAMALDWGPLDLFGCDRTRPLARVDKAGLVWLLNGDRLVALTENSATIETRTGNLQTYRRKPIEPGRVLAWEIAR